MVSYKVVYNAIHGAKNVRIQLINNVRNVHQCIFSVTWMFHAIKCARNIFMDQK